ALMPTSHNMIIYAFAAQAATGMISGHMIKGVSIGDLMFAGLVPVFWIMACMLVTAYWQARKYGYPKSEDGRSLIERFPGWSVVLRTFIASVPGLLVIAIILFCVMKGITTATEAAAIAVSYSLLLLYINIIQVVLGIFLDMAAHILITTPLFLPLAIQMGVGPVQFGMMLLLNCALGLVHPPVGTVQFVGCAIGNISIGEATKTA